MVYSVLCGPPVTPVVVEFIASLGVVSVGEFGQSQSSIWRMVVCLNPGKAVVRSRLGA